MFPPSCYLTTSWLSETLNCCGGAWPTYLQFAFIPTTKSKCTSHLHLGREESICEVPLRSVGRASSAYPLTPLLVFHANFRDRSTPDTEFLPLKALTNLIFPDPSHHKLFWAKIRISKSDEENEVPQFSGRLILLLRCVLCRAKILRLQQNHSNRVPRAARVEAGLDKPRPSKTSSAFPQSVSNFSVQVRAPETIGNLKLPQN